MKTKILLMSIVLLMMAEQRVTQADIINLEWTTGHLDVVDGDTYGELWIKNEASVAVYQGGYISKLEMWNQSTGDIYGGDVDWLFSSQNSVTDIYGGIMLWIGAWDSSIINLYAYDVAYHAFGGLENRSWVSGVYLDGDIPFDFTLYTDDAYSHIQTVPEPASMLLLCIGGVKIYSKSLSKRDKEVLGFTPHTFDHAINSTMSTRLLAVSQLCT